MIKQVFELPYPPAVLNPNVKVFWRKLYEAKKKARHCAYIVVKSQLRLINIKAPVKVHYDIYPPDMRRRDADNAKAACKAYQDGIADAIAIDDYDFITSDRFYKNEPVRPHGKVLVTIELMENAI